MAWSSIGSFALSLVLAPLLKGIINRTKSLMAGRKGPPLLQPYYDLRKLALKGAVYSTTATWVFRAGPMISLSAILAAATFIPLGAEPPVLAFPGDLVLFAYLLGLSRFFTVIAALDTGSSFEAMGASREVTFSALTEPALFLALAAVAGKTGSLSLSSLLRISPAVWAQAAPVLGLTAAALAIVFLSENARIPVDDPATHLELTMIHEVMVLDHSGPDLAMIEYGASLKMWAIGAIIVGLLVPAHAGERWMDAAYAVAAMFGLAVLTGILESSMARLKLVRVPQLLVGADVLAALSLVLLLW